MSDLSQTIQALQELQRMHQLNLELLEQLGVFFEWILNSEINIPDKEKFNSLFFKTKALLEELYCGKSYTFVYRKPSDDFLHDKQNRRGLDRTLNRNVFISRQKKSMKPIENAKMGVRR